MIGTPYALRLQFAHPRGFYRSRPALVHPSSFGLCYPLRLALAAEIRLELGEHPKHVEEALAGGRGGVERLLGGIEG